MKQAIPVKEKFVREGQAADCKLCPVALALSEFYDCVYIGPETARVSHRDWERLERYVFDETVRQWIWNFDKTGTGQPFVLILDHKERTAEMLQS